VKVSRSVVAVRFVLLTAASTASVGAQPRAPFSGPRLRVIGTNDFHGALEAKPGAGGVMRGGAAAMAATIRRAESECTPPECHWILLDGGDEFQGTLASNLAYGHPISQIFNELTYTAAAVGNHEFDWGQDTLKARMREEHYNPLAANVRFEDGRDVPWIRDDTLVSRGPFKVGIIGIITRDTKTSAKASTIAGLRFDDPAPIIDSLAKKLRGQGANKIVVVAHAGGFCDASGANNCRGEIFDVVRALKEHVDAVIAGHSHSLINAEINGTLIVQAYSRGTAIDVVDLSLDPATSAHHEVRSVFPDSIVPDAGIARRVAAAEQVVAAKASSVVATLAQELPYNSNDDARSPLGDVVADAMRAAGHSDFAVMNHGGVRSPLHAGAVTYSDVFEVQPFANVLYKITAKGADMRRYFEKIVGGRRPNAWISGVTLAYDSTRAPGSRLTSIVVAGGKPLDDAATYTVVINDFMLTGGSGLGFPGQPIASEPTNVVDLDALIAYLKSLPQPVKVAWETRIRAGS
jgi:2',3'-cyclic-nucleotide 2'-phosphodiesterase (5'-nucleotidase family)